MADETPTPSTTIDPAAAGDPAVLLDVIAETEAAVEQEEAAGHTNGTDPKPPTYEEALKELAETKGALRMYTDALRRASDTILHLQSQNESTRRRLTGQRKMLRRYQDLYNVYMGAYVRGGAGVPPTYKKGRPRTEDKLVLFGALDAVTGVFGWSRNPKTGELTLFHSAHGGMYWREVATVPKDEIQDFANINASWISAQVERQAKEEEQARRQAAYEAEQAARVATAEAAPTAATVTVPLMEAVPAAPSPEPSADAQVAA